MTIADTLQTMGVIVALVASIITVYLNLKRAPVDRRVLDIDASVSASTALKSYSDEVIKLRSELVDVRKCMMELEVQVRHAEQRAERFEGWAKRLHGQVISMGGVPVALEIEMK